MIATSNAVNITNDQPPKKKQKCSTLPLNKTPSISSTSTTSNTTPQLFSPSFAKAINNQSQESNKENETPDQNSSSLLSKENDKNEKQDTDLIEKDDTAKNEYYPEEEPVPFVEGWNFIRTLGEGAFGQVRLALSSDNKQRVAIKIINLLQHPNCKAAVNKEINIHKRLNHENIITYYGDRYDDSQNTRYIFLEYATGTELYDRIDPDKGMNYSVARHIFRQLLLAVKYIHELGFTHRDIKPENILVTEDNKVKLIDFGLATVFRFKAQERKLAKRCGTPPYLAPEVLVGQPYHATPAEVWSCGIVLVAMLAGELPWTEASCDSEDWNSWIDKNPELESKTPWTKFDIDALFITRKILHYKPHKRLTIDQILDHRWMNDGKQKFKTNKVGEISKRLKQSRLKLKLKNEDHTKANHSGIVTSSQTIDMLKRSNKSDLKRLRNDDENDNFDFSLDLDPIEDQNFSTTQPVEIQNLILSKSQVPQGFSQYLSQGRQDIEQIFSGRRTMLWIDLVKVDKLYVDENCDNWLKEFPVFDLIEGSAGISASEKLAKELDNIIEALDLNILFRNENLVKISPRKVKNRLKPLIFNIYKKFEKDQILLDFRLSKGCGLDFKKHFISIRALLKKYIST